MGARCTIFNSLLSLLLVRLYKHDPSYKPCHTVGSQSRLVKNRHKQEGSYRVLHQLYLWHVQWLWAARGTETVAKKQTNKQKSLVLMLIIACFEKKKRKIMKKMCVDQLVVCCCHTNCVIRFCAPNRSWYNGHLRRGRVPLNVCGGYGPDQS